MNAPNYNFQTTEPDKNLALNEYYFVCDYSAHFLKTKNKEEGKAIFKNLAMELHPDKGGSPDEFMELNKQFVQFKQTFQ